MRKLGSKLRRGVFGFTLLAAATAAAPSQAQDDPLLKFPQEAPPPPPRALNLFDVLDAGSTSPLGEEAEGLSSAEMAERAKAYLEGTGGRRRNPEEAAYWLRRLTVEPFTNANDYARWAMETLANQWLPADPARRDAVTMRKLQLIWELLALSGDPRALCNLGFMYDEAIGVPRDTSVAREWFERAQAAGCTEAGPALADLK